MKRLFKLILSMIMCFSLCACGGDGGEVRLVNVYDDQYYLEFPSYKAFKKSIRKVDITKDNWNEYFEDYAYNEHVVNKNQFGDIEEEYDVLKVGFGLKKNIVARATKISFKVDGYIYYASSQVREDKLDDFVYYSVKANDPEYKTMNYKTNEVIEIKTHAEGAKEYYVFELDNVEKTGGIHVGDNHVTDAIGTLYVLDVPEGLYNGEKITQINFGKDGKEGGTGFGSGNIAMHYEE